VWCLDKSADSQPREPAPAGSVWAVAEGDVAGLAACFDQQDSWGSWR
jgi:hypothetical protein